MGHLKHFVSKIFPRHSEYTLQKMRKDYLDLLMKVLCGVIYKDSGQMKGEITPYNEQIRQGGWDWPTHAHTMIGYQRLSNVCKLMEKILKENTPGDVIETGVWRGGASIMMRAVLYAYGVRNRKVYVADSFEGLPAPNSEAYPADANSDFHEFPELAVSLEEVRNNFKVYGLLDDQVVFVKGWFKDTLPTLRVNSFALIRLDGDMYESTMDALVNLYDKLSPNGYVIIDDYHVVQACKDAVHDFCESRQLSPEMKEIDGVGIYWKKTNNISS